MNKAKPPNRKAIMDPFHIRRFILITVLLGLTLPALADESRYIVTLKAGEDANKIVKELKRTPHHIYRHALNGFAVTLDEKALEKLLKDKRVRAVEPDGRIELLGTGAQEIIPAAQLTNQVVPTGLLRLGLTNFPMVRLNGQDHRIDVDVAVLDSGIQLDHPDLNVYLPGSASFADGSTNGSDWHGHGTHGVRHYVTFCSWHAKSDLQALGCRRNPPMQKP